MIDLYTALRLCSSTHTFQINGQEYTREEIAKHLDQRKIKVNKIYYDLWNEVMCLEVTR